MIPHPHTPHPHLPKPIKQTTIPWPRNIPQPNPPAVPDNYSRAHPDSLYSPWAHARTAVPAQHTYVHKHTSSSTTQSKRKLTAYMGIEKNDTLKIYRIKQAAHRNTCRQLIAGPRTIQGKITTLKQRTKAKLIQRIQLRYPQHGLMTRNPTVAERRQRTAATGGGGDGGRGGAGTDGEGKKRKRQQY